jgi:hypothetical protein
MAEHVFPEISISHALKTGCGVVKNEQTTVRILMPVNESLKRRRGLLFWICNAISPLHNGDTTGKIHYEQDDQ